METIQKILLVFTLIGAINWGLVGILNFNLVSYLFGVGSLFTNIIYSIVGICAIFNVFILFGHLEFNVDR